MTEQPQQSTAQPGAVPARIDLDDLIEAVSRGVARAQAAQQDEVSGYASFGPAPQSSIVIGLVLRSLAGPSLPGPPFYDRE